ncbi:MAG: GNAT family N-acetyltransferase [Candidatus Omnitrophica bacterium]|nr:GNAT family N-acetyltransferase [Candidatus Omnitrophota bacterium]
MMKVHILTEGGKGIGLGHITRCISLYQAFKKRGISPTLVINGDDSVRKLLKGKKYRVFNWLKEQKKLFQMIRKGDIAVIDSYLAGHRTYKKISDLAPISAYLDDYKRLVYPRGIVINGGFQAKDIRYPRKENIKYLLGPGFIPIRTEFRDMPPRKIRPVIKSILISFGGCDTKNLTAKLLEFLNAMYPNVRKNILISDAFKDTQVAEKPAEPMCVFIKNPDPMKLKTVMLNSDIAISAGGQTLNELARTGTPTIGVCVAENQKMHLSYWAETGFLSYAGRYDDKDLLKKVHRAIISLQDKRVRKGMSLCGRETVDGRGPERIIKFILSEYFRNRLTLQKATLRDAREIFNLSTDKEVRKNSFQPKRFDFKHHLGWLRERLRDVNCVFYIFKIGHEFIGQLRFNVDNEKKCATVNISLVEKMRNFNLSSFLVENSIRKLLKHHKHLRSIRAYVKRHNIASVKLFERTNFKFSGNRTVKGAKTRVYIRKVSAGNV